MIESSNRATAIDVARHYDEVDPVYRSLWGEHLHHGLWKRGVRGAGAAVESLVDRVADLAGMRAGDEVCDVGCGYGAAARRWAERRGARVTGLTISPAQMRIARGAAAGGGPAPIYLLRDWMDNGLPSRSFDAVVAIESLSHMSDLDRFAREAHRVLRPGGRFVACAWLASERPRGWEAEHLLEPICAEGRLTALWSAPEVAGRLEAAGFEGVSVMDESRRVRRTWSVVLRRAARWMATPAGRDYLRDPANVNRDFLRAIVRIWLAYRVGCLRYGIFAATRGAG